MCVLVGDTCIVYRHMLFCTKCLQVKYIYELTINTYECLMVSDLVYNFTYRNGRLQAHNVYK